MKLSKSESLIFEATITEPFVYVFRIQDTSGRGPYDKSLIVYSKKSQGEDCGFIWSEGPHNLTTGHPDPGNDPGFDLISISTLINPGNPFFSFGFESISQLNSWFSERELKRLEEMGFSTILVKAKRVWSSGKQAFYEEGSFEDNSG